MESENIRVYEFAEKNKDECKKEPKYYINFVYIYEGEPSTLPKPKQEVVEHQHTWTVKVQHKISIEHQHAAKHQAVGVESQRKEIEH